MKVEEKPFDRLAAAVADEASFRKQVAGTIGQLLRDPGTEPVLKLLVVLGLLDLVAISFVLTVFLVHALCTLTPLRVGAESFHPFHYAMTIAGFFGMLMGISVPVVVKTSNREHAMQLDTSFEKIYEARAGKRPKIGRDS